MRSVKTAFQSLLGSPCSLHSHTNSSSDWSKGSVLFLCLFDGRSPIPGLAPVSRVETPGDLVVPFVFGARVTPCGPVKSAFIEA